MELKRDDIIKALDILERFDFFQGQRAGRELWNEKPFDVQEQDIAKFSQDIAWLKNFIKELTEENERLRNRVVCKVVIPDDKIEEIKNECLERVELNIKAIQADTVREMQERVESYIDVGHYRPPTEICFSELDVVNIIRKIAKEMLTEIDK